MPRRKHATNTRRHLERMEREAKALGLKKLGATNDEIGRQLGCSSSRACHIVQEAIARLPAADASELRKLQVAKLDDLEASLLPDALRTRATADGKEPVDLETRLKVVDRIVRIHERRARYEGLDRQPGLGSGGTPPALMSDEERAARLADDLRIWLEGAAAGAAVVRDELAEGVEGNGHGSP